MEVEKNVKRIRACDVNCFDEKTNTPLYYAAKSNHFDVSGILELYLVYFGLAALIKLGADVNVQCEKGDTPLHVAFINNNPQVINYSFY